MTQRRKLLVIDDDPAIFRYLRRGLKHEDYDVAAAPRHGMLARMDEWQPDVVLLDLALPHARSEIQAIKARSPAPLIGLLPREDTQAMITALDAGVHDCVPKPFSLEELAAHIYKVLRRDMWCRGETSEFKSPTLRIDLVFRRVYRGDRIVALTGRQFQLLKLLLDADGRVLDASRSDAARSGGMPSGAVLPRCEGSSRTCDARSSPIRSSRCIF